MLIGVLLIIIPITGYLATNQQNLLSKAQEEENACYPNLCPCKDVYGECEGKDEYEVTRITECNGSQSWSKQLNFANSPRCGGSGDAGGFGERPVQNGSEPGTSQQPSSACEFEFKYNECVPRREGYSRPVYQNCKGEYKQGDPQLDSACGSPPSTGSPGTQTAPQQDTPSVQPQIPTTDDSTNSEPRSNQAGNPSNPNGRDNGASCQVNSQCKWSHCCPTCTPSGYIPPGCEGQTYGQCNGDGAIDRCIQ